MASTIHRPRFAGACSARRRVPLPVCLALYRCLRHLTGPALAHRLAFSGRG